MLYFFLMAYAGIKAFLYIKNRELRADATESVHHTWHLVADPKPFRMIEILGSVLSVKQGAKFESALSWGALLIILSALLGGQ